jgi:hypothetical protein
VDDISFAAAGAGAKEESGQKKKTVILPFVSDLSQLEFIT